MPLITDYYWLMDEIRLITIDYHYWLHLPQPYILETLYPNHLGNFVKINVLKLATAVVLSEEVGEFI